MARDLSSDWTALRRIGGALRDTSSEDIRGRELEPGGRPKHGGFAAAAGGTGARNTGARTATTWAAALGLPPRLASRRSLLWADGLRRGSSRVDAASAADRSADDISTRQVAPATLLSRSEGGCCNLLSTTPRPRCDVLVALL